MTLKTKLTEMFGIKHPIFSAPMGPYRTTELTIATSEAGGLGTISHAVRSMEGTEKDFQTALRN